MNGESVHALADAITLLDRAAEAGEQRLNLVPSEARMSPLARLPLTTDLYSRYFFNQQADPTFWQFRGGREVGHLEADLGAAALQRLGRARFANLRPLSGLSAMQMVLSALGGSQSGSIVHVAQSSGGHFATAAVIRRLGRQPLAVTVQDGRVDLEELGELLSDHSVALVYLDLQNTLVELDIAQVVTEVRRLSPTTRVHVDSSHTLGLVLGGVHSNPLELGADSFGGSTHKSFPGPQKGAILTNDPAVNEALVQAQFDLVSSHHFASTLSLSLAAAEFEIFGGAYATQQVSNARHLARSLKDAGFDVGGREPELTATHQVWMWCGDLAEITQMGERLAAAGFNANVQDDLPGRKGPAFRLGVNEITFEGAGRHAINLLSEAFIAAHAGKTGPTAADVRATFREPFHLTQDQVQEFRAHA